MREVNLISGSDQAANQSDIKPAAAATPAVDWDSVTVAFSACVLAPDTALIN